MRSQYRELTTAEKAQIAELQHIGETFCNLCDALRVPNPEIDTWLMQATLRMEEAVFWAVKGVTAS